MTPENEEIPEQDILSARCPCCGQLIPVRLTLVGEGVDEHYISIAGNSQKTGNAPFPDFELSLDVDLIGLKFEGGLDEIIKNMSPNARKLLLRRYDYDKEHGIYTKEKIEPITLDEIRRKADMAGAFIRKSV